MGKRSRRERPDSGPARTPATSASATRMLQLAAVMIAAGIGVGLLVRSSRVGGAVSANPAGGFTQVGRNGPVFTVSVPKAKAADEEYLMNIAEQLSAQEVRTGASGQISVMVWPDDVETPKTPPTTEFDASMKTQAAGIFVNPKLNVKHLIRFKNGETVSERDFGKKVQ